MVGRLAPQIGRLLAGKHKPTYLPHVDCGDYVVVVNARAAVLTGNKMRDKLYKWHTGWMGGLKSLTARQLHERAPERLLEHAVKGMLPPNTLRSERMRRLKIFPDGEHTHERQVSQSKAYAYSFIASHVPRKWEPKAKAVSGTLVKNYALEAAAEAAAGGPEGGASAALSDASRSLSAEAEAAIAAESAEVMAADLARLEAAFVKVAADEKAAAAAAAGAGRR